MTVVTDDRHRLLIWYFDPEGREDNSDLIDVEIIHPDECDRERDDCPLAYLSNAIGVNEGLELIEWIGPGRWRVSDMGWHIMNIAVTTSRCELPIYFRFSCGYDYWGEYDETLEWWPR